MNYSDSNTNINDLLEIYSIDPFFSPVQFCKQRGLSGSQFENLINTVRSNHHLVDILVKGPARQYWKSIASIRNTTNFYQAVDRTPAYPSRLGLYPGVTCQFKCQFCGRREGTEFKSSLAEQSLELFDKLLTEHAQVPNQDKIIRLSGGLEPTTNKRITDIVRLIHSKGFEAEMYTNGFNFTDAWLDRQPGMFELDRIRFSVYGYDSESYPTFTEHAKSHTVLDNIKRFLDRSTMPVGINYVILTDRLDHFSKVIDWIEQLNDTTRGLSWVSLREDSSQNLWQLTNQERTSIQSHLERLESVLAGKTTIDYGYTLWPLRHGQSIGNIRQADVRQLLPKAFPQISVVVDIEGNVYPYHDVFPDRPGQEKHLIGRIIDQDLYSVVSKWINSLEQKKMTVDDLKFLDTSDHMITLLIRQQEELQTLGVYQWLV